MSLKISDDDKEAINKAVEEAEKYKDSEDKDKLEKAVKELNDVLMPIGAKMYQQAAEEAPADADKDDDKKSKKKSKKSDDAVEGEVVDEK